MARSAKLHRTLRGLAVPLFLSLAVHGVLLLALWCWPVHPRGPALSIECTRISLDTCLLDRDPSTNPPRHRPPAGSVSTDLNPQLIEAPPVVSEGPVAPSPTISSLPPRAGTTAGSGPSVSASGVRGGLFPLPATAASVVYVLDRSVSMGVDNKLDLACRELLASLKRLPPATRFQIIAYNTCAEPLVINGRIDLLPAEPAIVEQAALALGNLTASGDTNHANALRRGLMLHPDVLYLVTDADDLTREQVEFLTRCNQGSSIHAIELTRRRNPRPDNPLAQLARGNGGSYRRVWTGD